MLCSNCKSDHTWSESYCRSFSYQYLSARRAEIVAKSLKLSLSIYQIWKIFDEENPYPMKKIKAYWEDEEAQIYTEWAECYPRTYLPEELFH